MYLLTLYAIGMVAMALLAGLYMGYKEFGLNLHLEASVLILILFWPVMVLLELFIFVGYIANVLNFGKEESL